MAKKKQKKAKNSKRSATRSTLLMIISSIVLILVFHTGYIFFITGMLPSIVAYYLDRSPSRTNFHTVLACNLSGTIPFMARILKEGSSSGYITELMGEATNWLIIYASAGFGWLLVFTTPLFAQFLISMFHQGQIMRYEAMQTRLIEDWGPEVSHFFPNETQDDIP